MSDYAAANLIETQMQADDKAQLLAKMVGLLIESGRVGNDEVLMRELIKRERVMSTGIGGGIAIPHALSDDIQDLSLVFAHTNQPIDFQALDKQPVDLVFMLVGPRSAGNLYVKLLARVSRVLQNQSFKDRLRAAKTPEEVLQIFHTEESAH